MVANRDFSARARNIVRVNSGLLQVPLAHLNEELLAKGNGRLAADTRSSPRCQRPEENSVRLGAKLICPLGQLIDANMTTCKVGMNSRI